MKRIRYILSLGAFGLLLVIFLSVTDQGRAEILTREDRASADALFTNGTVPIIKIQVPLAGMNSLRRDGRAYVKATLRERGLLYTNVLIRLKGGAGSFRPLDDKPGFTVKFEEANAAFHGLNKIHLNNSVQDGTFLSEWTCSEIFRQAGVPAPRATPAIVELNGKRLGFYVLLESVDREFLARYFKHTHGNVYSPSWNADITQRLECIGGRETNNWADLRALAAAARASKAEHLPEVLDIDRFLSFMAVEVMLCHWDGYTFNVKNYLVYHNLDEDKMVFIPHDLDQMLQDSNRPIVPRNVQGVVSRAILKRSDMQERYLQRLAQLTKTIFMAPVLTRRIDALVTQLSPQIKAYDPVLAAEFANHAQNLKWRITSRAKSLDGQLRALRLEEH